MNMNEAKHISEVCKELGTTSRTIRYYEQLGLIRTIRDGKNAPRRLDAKNTEQLRKILFLRKIGLSLDEILEIVRDGLEIVALHSRIRLLEKVTKAAENGDDIYAVELEASPQPEDAARCRIAAQCTRLVVEQRFSEIPAFLAPKLRQFMAPEFISMSWNEFIKPCGAFRKTGGQTVEGNFVKNHLIFEKMDALVIIGFCDEGIKGIVFQYLKEKENPHV